MNEFEAAITDLSHDGQGVARIEGKTVFVSGALLGEQVRLRIRKRHRNFDEAEAIEILTPSPHRVVPRCSHFGNAAAVRYSTWTPQHKSKPSSACWWTTSRASARWNRKAGCRL